MGPPHRHRRHGSGSGHRRRRERGDVVIRIRTAADRIRGWVHRHKDAAFVLAVFITIQVAVFLQGAHTQAVQREQQAAQRKTAVQVERRLCLAVSKQAALKPPAGNPVDNPSRAYLQGEHRTWGVMAGILDCPPPR
jgi:hypothetical protein